MPFYETADERSAAQNKLIIEMERISKLKKKGKCETVGCDGIGNTNMKSKTHYIVKNCPIRNKIITLRHINALLSKVKILFIIFSLTTCCCK
jgi:hypothetical protein